MRLGDLIHSLPVRLEDGSLDLDVSTVHDDSRAVTPGTLFVARPGGSTDGTRFIDDAVERGAVAVLTPEGITLTAGVTHLVGDRISVVLGHLAERIEGSPSARLRLIGVTGTNGKTTVAWLLRQLVGAGGERCGLLGTVGVDHGDGALHRARLTTPGPVELSRTLRTMLDAGCTHAVMEVSSHALDQHRADGLRFFGGIFTNLSGDHLDYHGSMSAYRDAKARLFAMVVPEGCVVVNADDPVATVMAAASRAPVVDASATGGATATATAHVHAARIDGTDVTFRGPWGALDVTLPLAGDHNVMNALEATAMAHALGVEPATLARALARVTAPPGRLEPVADPVGGVTVLVDYAHTDDALDHVLAALRPLVTAPRRLIVVFGCGGDRDRTKRPRMARAAARWADDIVITSDNPRTEDPRAIVDEVATGLPETRRAEAVLEVDRRAAIAGAIARARPGDVVVIAGKGHEAEQIVGTTTRPFDDRRIAAALLERRREPVA